MLLIKNFLKHFKSSIFLLILICHHKYVQSSVAPGSTPPPTTTTTTTIAPERVSTVKPSISLYDKTLLWMRRFNARFLPLMRPCLQRGSNCQCLSDLDHLARIANVTDLLKRTTNKKPSSPTSSGNRLNLPLNDRRKLATILLSNVIRLDAFQERKQMEWYKCTLDADSICPKGGADNNNSMGGSYYYQDNRKKLLELLMPDIAANRTIISPSIYSFEFVQNLDHLLRRLNRNLISLNKVLISNPSTIQTWFGRENLLNDLDRLNDGDLLVKIETVALLIVNRLVKGENIELFESRFLRDIIERYGRAPESPVTTRASLDDDEAVNIEAASNQDGRLIDQDGLAKLLNDLHIGGLIEAGDKDDDDDDHNHHHEEEDDHNHDPRGHRSMLLYKPHNHRIVSNRNITTPAVGVNDLHSDESKIMATIVRPNDASQHPKDNDPACLDYSFYLNRIQNNKNNAKSTKYALTAQDIQQLAPIFLQQILSKACEKVETARSAHRVEESSQNRGPHTMMQLQPQHNIDIKNLEIKLSTEALIYSNISVLVISCSSLVGLLLIPFLKSRTMALIINALIGLAYGSMSGDALFHLIPAVLSLHSHDHEHDTEKTAAGRRLARHNHNDSFNSTKDFDVYHGGHGDNESKEYLWLMMAVLASIYVLFLFEVISNAVAKLKDKVRAKRKKEQLAALSVTTDSNNNGSPDDHAHESYHHHRKMDHQLHHHQRHEHHSHHFMDHQSSNSNNISTLSLQPQQPSPSGGAGLNKVEDKKSMSTCTLISSQSDSIATANKQETVCFGMTSLAMIITLSDSIHNLLDGVAIGISFSSSISRGLSTSIAVFCHELPHEFGDFAVMLSTGMSVRRVAILNFMSALTAFIGLYIGLLLGSNEQANRWALAVCAGLFLYIALCDMLSELKEMVEPIFTKRWFLSFFMKNFGILLGYFCMVALALLEDQINFA